MSMMLCKYINNIFIKAFLNLKNNDTFVNNINLLRKLLSRDYEKYRQMGDVNQIYHSFDIRTKQDILCSLVYYIL